MALAKEISPTRTRFFDKFRTNCAVRDSRAKGAVSVSLTNWTTPLLVPADMLTKEHLNMKCFSMTLVLTVLCGRAVSPAGSADSDQHGFLNRVHQDAGGKESKYVVFVPHDYKG